MDKEEFRVKLEEINKLVQAEDYKGAMDIVDSIDWRRVKNVRTLCVVGEIYAANKRYEDSKEIFLLAYNKASIGKNILYRLIEISLKMNDVNDAMEFFEEFKQVASNDNTRYVLEYKICKAKNASLNEQIRILEEYKDREFTEKWSYELAQLYYQAGEKDKALDLCNEIVLWFSEGKYVTKALDLKMRMGQLTGEEKEKFEQQFVPKLLTPDEKKALDEKKAEEAAQSEEAPKETADSKKIESIKISERDLNSAESIQEKISKGIRDIFSGKKKDEEDAEDEDILEMGEEALENELIKTDADETETENVPELEPEKEGERPDFSQTIKMPSLKIPDSMKKIVTPKAPELQMPDFVADKEGEEESSDKSFDKNFDFDFNLEDTILAAASAQGIEIPKEQTIAEEPEEEEVPEIPRLEEEELFEEEEEFLSEEDLQSAEDEFLNGPAARADVNPTDLGVESFLDDLMKQEEPEEEQEPLSEEEELERFIASIQPVDDTDPLDIIPREKELREEEMKLFTYFVKVPGLKDQIVETLCEVQLAAAESTSKTGNVIVMGGQGCGKTRLISGLIPAICSELNMEAAKIAYVFADQINDKDIDEIVKKLAGGFLVIESANQLNQNTVEQLDKAMEKDTNGMRVIIEDEKIGMRKLIARFPKFAKKFTSMINIPVFTNDELVNFARIYTKENGYVIDQMGMLALYNLISENQKEDEPMSIDAVKELIDNAIAKSQSGIRKLQRNMSKKRTDIDGNVVLYEKDFSK